MQYNCEKCKYNTNFKQSYDRHLQSEKHKSREITKIECREHKCNKCNTILLSKTSLWRHKKTCIIEKSTLENTMIPNDIHEMIKTIFEKQNFIEQLIVELSKKETAANITNNSNSNNNITNNNNFDVTFFLNEQCKDAINIKDFIKDMIVDTETLKTIQNIGYVDGVSKCITDNLEKYTKFTRPIHYINDTKKELNTIHIRDRDKWKEESDEKKPLLSKTIYNIDEKIYDNFRIYQGKTLDEQLELKNILLKGSYTHYQDSISDQVLHNVKIEV